jgi:hypothetical protein
MVADDATIRRRKWSIRQSELECWRNIAVALIDRVVGVVVSFRQQSAVRAYPNANGDTLFHWRPQCVQSRDGNLSPWDNFPEGVFRCLTKQSQTS